MSGWRKRQIAEKVNQAMSTDPILLFVAQVVAPNSLRAYMADANLRLREETTRSVLHEAKLPEYPTDKE